MLTSAVNPLMGALSLGISVTMDARLRFTTSMKSMPWFGEEKYMYKAFKYMSSFISN